MSFPPIGFHCHGSFAHRQTFILYLRLPFQMNFSSKSHPAEALHFYYLLCHDIRVALLLNPWRQGSFRKMSDTEVISVIISSMLF